MCVLCCLVLMGSRTDGHCMQVKYIRVAENVLDQVKEQEQEARARREKGQTGGRGGFSDRGGRGGDRGRGARGRGRGDRGRGR